MAPSRPCKGKHQGWDERTGVYVERAKDSEPAHNAVVASEASLKHPLGFFACFYRQPLITGRIETE